MMQSVEASLRRLKTDRIDLLGVHMPDSITPVDEIASADCLRSPRFSWSTAWWSGQRNGNCYRWRSSSDEGWRPPRRRYLWLAMLDERANRIRH